MSGERFQSPDVLRRTIAVTAALTAGSMLVGACNNDDNEAERLDTPAGEIAAMCDTDPFNLDAYSEEVGTGPFEKVDAALEQNAEHADIRSEVASELAEGNAMGVALSLAQLNQQNSAYNPGTLLEEAQTIFDDIYDNKEAFSGACETVAEAYLTEDVGVVAAITAEEVVEITNEYGENEQLDSLNLEVNADTQKEIPVIGFQDANGAVLAGIVLDEARNGRYVMVKTVGENAADVTEDSAPEQIPATPELGEEGEPIDADAEVDEDDRETAGEETDDNDDGEAAGDDGATGEPGVGGACDRDRPTPDCEGEDPGPGGPGDPEQPTDSSVSTAVPGPTTIPGVTTTTTPGGHTTTTIPRPTTTTTTVRPTTTTTTTTTTIPRPTTTAPQLFELEWCDIDKRRNEGGFGVIMFATGLTRAERDEILADPNNIVDYQNLGDSNGDGQYICK